MSQRTWSRRSAIGGAVAATASVALAGQAAADRPGFPSNTANGRLYEIGHGRQRAVIAGVAATLLSWRVDGTELLLTHGANEVGEAYQGKTILPWPNRIDQGKYTFDGQELQVPINEPDREAALHGLMSFVEWSVVRHNENSVLLEYLLHPHYGYPFSMAFRVEYALREDGLHSTWWAKNVGPTPAPFGTANHSFVAASDKSIDSIGFELPAGTYYLVNDRLIPTGTASVAGTKFDFRERRPLGSTVMDTAFTELKRGSDGTAVVRFERPGGANVELWVDESHEYLQVYTDDAPETDRPPRGGITVEPMTCAPNAFITGDGLVKLAPGEVHKGSWGYRAV